MTEHGEPWTNLDFELFHDEQLDSERVPGLSEALRKDAELRKQLARVRRIDDALRTVLLRPRAKENFSYLVSRRAVLAMASLVFALGTVIWLSLPRTMNSPITQPRIVAAPEYQSVRVVFSLPVSSGENRAAPHQAESRMPLSSDKEKIFLSRLGDSLAAGQFERVHELIEAASPERRRAGVRHLGEVLRSAEAAESVLDGFSPEEQLLVCGEWAAVATIRPVVFARLRQLSYEPSLTTEVDQVLGELSTDPALRAWIHGYQLALRS